MALFRRVALPTGDLLKCRNAGFVDPTVNEVMALRSPAGGVGCHILSPVLKLTKTFIEMFHARQTPSLAKIFDMLDIEKNNVHGQSLGQTEALETNSDSGSQQVAQNGTTNDDTMRKLQLFVYEQFENLFHILAQFCQIGHQFYKQPGLATALVTSVFQSVDNIPGNLTTKPKTRA